MACTCDGEAFADLPTELAIKPAVGDWFGIDDISDNETKKISYATLKSLFFKTDEANTGLTGSVQWNDNVRAKWGNTSDLQIYHDATDSLIFNNLLNSETILRCRDGAASTIDMLRLNPAGPTISISTSNIAHTNNSTHGLSFNSSGHTVIKQLLDCRGNVDLNANYISGDAGSHGLSMSGENAVFSGNIGVTGQINANKAGNFSIQTNGNVDISGDLTADGACTFGGTVDMTGRLSSTLYIATGEYIEASGYAECAHLRIGDGIAAPGATLGYAKIYVDSADGDLKVKFGNGFVATLAADS